MTALVESDTAPAQFAFDHGALGGIPGRFAFVISGAAPWVARGREATAQATLARLAFPPAMQREQPNIEARLYLPDPNDIHVLAVAISAHADAIITFNAADFPRPVLADEGLIRLDPDQLLCQIHAHHPGEVAQVVTNVHATAERMLGEVIPLKSLMKRAQLRRLGKLLLPSA